MYLPKHFEQCEQTVLHTLMRAYPLGAWVVSTHEGLIANHVPFLLDASRGAHGTLCAHVPRANPVWQECSTGAQSLVMFQGPQAYVSPSWYPSKHETGKAVPTWNYAVVHAYGVPRAIEDGSWLLEHLSQLSDTHEASQAIPWKLSQAPADYIDRLLNALVGIEIPIAKLTGKWKVSQNRSDTDRLGVAAGLAACGEAPMAALVQGERIIQV